MTDKIVVLPEVYEKVKKWTEQGKTVYRCVCANLGCLAEAYTTIDLSKERRMCPNCGSMGGGFFHNEGTVMPADLDPKERLLEDITVDDLSFDVTDPPGWAVLVSGCTVVNLRMTISKHWRPIDLPYRVEPYESLKEYEDRVIELEKALENKSKFVDDMWDELVCICERDGYKLVKMEEKVEVIA